MAKIPGAGGLGAAERSLRDIGSMLDGISKSNQKWTDALPNFLESYSGISAKIREVEAAQSKFASDENIRQLSFLRSELDALGSKWAALGKTIGGKVVREFDRLGKSLLNLGISVVVKGIDLLYDGIHRVYELQEKWTKAMGEFRNRLGVTTQNLGMWSKAAAKVEGTIFGLTGAFGQGAPLVNEFQEALGRVEDVTKESQKGLVGVIQKSVLAARAFGIGSTAAGQLGRALQQQGDSLEELPGFLKETARWSKVAGVSSAAFGREIAQSRNFMVSFGKEGRSAFLKTAAYAAKLGVSLRSLEAFTKTTDTIDSTAQAAAKLNTVFGTTINALDLMLENDPAKRLEMVRQALLGQNIEYKNLTRYQQQFLAETLKMSEDEIAGVLQRGKTLADLEKEKEKQRKAEKKHQMDIRYLIRQTATTLVSIKQQFDKVTGAIARMLRPFAEMIGLVDKGSKGAWNFGKFITGAFDKLTKFLDRIAANPEWQQFMRDIGRDVRDFFDTVDKGSRSHALTDWLRSGISFAKGFWGALKTLGSVIKDYVIPAFKWIIDHWKPLLIAWGALKGIGILGGIRQSLGAFGGVGGGGALVGAGRPAAEATGQDGQQQGPQAPGRFGNFAQRAGNALTFGALGAGVAGLAGAGAEVTTGAGIGGAVGGIFGPIGGVLGAGIGALLGKAYKALTQSKAQDALEEALDQLTDTTEALNKLQRAEKDIVDARRQQQDLVDQAFKGDAVGQGVLRSGRKTLDDLQAQLVKIVESQKDPAQTAKDQAEIAQLQAKASKKQAELDLFNIEIKKKKEGKDWVERAAIDYAAKEKQQRLEDDIAKAQEAIAIKRKRFMLMEANLAQDRIRIEQKINVMRDQEMEFVKWIKDHPGSEGFSKSGGWKEFLESKGMGDVFKRLFDYNAAAPQNALGGVYSSASRVTVGEAGTEAVVPLRRYGSSAPAIGRALVNYASTGATGGGGATKIVAGDVYLDGRLVGRHVVRQLIEGDGY